MKSFVSGLLLTSLFVLMSFNTVISKNRFNVFTYSDYANISNLDSFYIQLSDSFMVSMLYTFNADSSGKYKKLHNLDLELFTNHWRSSENQRFLIGTDLFLYDAANALHARMGVANVSAVQGYFIDPSDYVGDIFPDDIDGRSILRARENIDNAGILHPKFSKGIFHLLNPLIGGAEFTYEAQMRLPDTVGDPEIIVAKMILEEGSISSCSTSTSKYAVYRYNDTLLIAYDGNNYISYPTIDRTSPNSNSVSTCVDYCVGSTFADKSTMTNICYMDSTGETICTIPYKFVKDIYDSNFTSEHVYESVFMDCYGKWGWGTNYQYKVYWTEERTLYLDSLFSYTDKGFLFDSLVYNAGSGIADSIEKWYDNHINAKKNVEGVYFIDEPKGVKFQSLEKVNTILDSIDNSNNDYPTRQFSTLGEYQGSNINAYGGQYYDSYIDYSQDDYFVFDYYVCFAYLTSSSEITDFTNIQCMFNNMEGAFEEAQTRISAINTQQGKNIDFWVALQAFDSYGEFDDNGTTKHVKVNRKYTANEAKASINMALLYGTKGIGYWEYVSKVNCNKTTTFQSDSINFKNLDDILQASSDYSCTGSPRAIADYCLIPADSCAVGARPYSNTGLVCRDEGKPQKLWDDFRIMNIYMDSMAYFFNTATWHSAGNELEDLFSKQGSFIDSIRTLANYDDAFIQVGFFEDTNSSPLAYILNKRVDDGTYDWVDSQTVRLFFPDSASIYEVWDVYANTCDTIFDSSGYMMADIFLEPGEAKLIKRNFIHSTNFSGTVDPSLSLWNWPTYATVNMVGDITIDSGKTFTINSTNIKVAGFADATSSGSDSNKTEIIVNGELRIEGTPTNRVFLAPDTSADQSWRGIRVFSPTTSYSGKLYMDNVEIKGAYEGVKIITNSIGDTLRLDTIMNCLFDSCFIRGIIVDKKNVYLSSDTFLNTGNGYGIYLNGGGLIDSTTIIRNNYFQNVKYPIYSYYASPLIEFNDFYITDTTSSVGYGQAAIWLNRESDAKIENCDINNYKTGIKIDFLSDVEITSVSFDSDSLYLLSDTVSYMDIAIDGNGLLSDCKVRNSCFKKVDERHVFQGNTTFDLGTASSLGNNSFFVETYCKFSTCPFYYNPEKAVENISTDTLFAVGNYWELDTVWWTAGIIDDSSPNLFPNLACIDQIGEFKVNTFAENSELIPKVFSVSQNYPNPFNPGTQILFTLPEVSHVKIEIFNIMGQRVKLLLDQSMEAGEHTIQWNSVDKSGNKVSSGIYLYRIEAGENIETKKMILLK